MEPDIYEEDDNYKKTRIFKELRRYALASICTVKPNFTNTCDRKLIDYI